MEDNILVKMIDDMITAMLSKGSVVQSNGIPVALTNDTEIAGIPANIALATEEPEVKDITQENKKMIKAIFDKKIVEYNMLEAKAIISKLNLVTEESNGDDLTDMAYKAYRYITDAMFITLKNPTLKKEFYTKLTDLQNLIEKFLFTYNKEAIKAATV